MARPRHPARPRRAAPAPGGRTFPWPPLAAALAAVLAWLPSLANGFARDDGELIPALLRSSRPLAHWLAADFWAPAGHGSGLWRPLVTATLWLDGRLGGGAPFAFHLGNVLAHAAAAALLAALLQAVGLPALVAAGAALWFALMPAHAEAVAWVVGRTDVWCALFALAALLCDRRARAGGGRGWAVAAPVAYAGALLAKESAAALPLVVLALDRAASDRPPLRATLRRLAPWLVVAAAWFAAHQALGRPGGPPMYLDPAEAASWRARAWLLLPHFAAALSPGVAHAPDALPRAAFGVAGGAAGTLAVGALLAWLAWRRAPALPALALFVAPLLPLLAAAFAGRALPAGERLVYLSSAGAAWLFALALARAASPAARRGAAAATVLLLLASAAESVRLQPAWRDDASVYEAMRRAQPGNPVGWLGSADAAAQRGERAEAERLLARATALGPGVPARHLVRAALHYRYGEWPQVVVAADSALAALPGLDDARVLRATAHVRLRQLAEAEADTRALLAARSGDPQVLAVEGQRLLLAGDASAAAAMLDRAVRGAPDDVAAWYALGIARAIGGEPGAARDAFARTVALDAGYYDGWLALARAAAQAGDVSAAREALGRAAALPEAADGRVAATATALGLR